MTGGLLFPVPVKTGKAGPTRRDEISISRMPCRVMSHVFVWQMWMMLHTPSFPSHLLDSIEVARCTLHARLEIQNPKSNQDNTFVSRRSVTRIGNRHGLAVVSVCSGFSFALRYPSCRCSPLGLANVLISCPSSTIIPRHIMFALEQGRGPADSAAATETAWIGSRCFLRIPKPIPSRPTSRLTWMAVVTDSALVDPNGAVLYSAILRGGDAVSQPGSTVQV